jgi:hypothetical protein
MTDPNEDLKNLFAEATENIRAHGTLDDIRARAGKATPTTRRWFLPSVAAAAVMALVIGGAFWVNRNHADPNGAGPVASTDPVVSPTDSATASAQFEYMYYLGDTANGPRLFAEGHPVVGPSNLGRAAADEAINGSPLDPDYKNLWPAGVKVDAVSLIAGANNSIKITLSGTSVADRPAGLTAEQAALEVTSLVTTVQVSLKQPLPTNVWFEQDGKPLTTVLGVSGTASGAATSSYTGVTDADLAPVEIRSPGDAEKFTPGGDLGVLGLASTVEGNVLWELQGAGGTVVKHGFTTAQECCKLSPYKFIVKNLQPGTYTLVVHDIDDSGAGGPVNQDTKEIIVE